MNDFLARVRFGGVTLSKEVGAIYLDRYLVYSKFLGRNYEEPGGRLLNHDSDDPPSPKVATKHKKRRRVIHEDESNGDEDGSK